VNDAVLLVLVLGCALLFRLGGWINKSFRRYGIPVLVALCWLVSGVIWWKVAIACGLLCASLHLGYGETVPYWGKFLVALSWCVGRLVLGWSWWIVVTPIAFVIMFALSNWSATEQDFKWGIVEILTGGLIGATYVF
jgi:hypothetical protein